MSYHKPPASDAERLMNVLEALASDLADEDPTPEELQAEAEASGIDFEAWAEEIRAKVEARVEAERRERDGDGGAEAGARSGVRTPLVREAPEETEEDAERRFAEALAAQREARAREGLPRWAPTVWVMGEAAG